MSIETRCEVKYKEILDECSTKCFVGYVFGPAVSGKTCMSKIIAEDIKKRRGDIRIINITNARHIPDYPDGTILIFQEARGLFFLENANASFPKDCSVVLIGLENKIDKRFFTNQDFCFHVLTDPNGNPRFFKEKKVLVCQ